MEKMIYGVLLVGALVLFSDHSVLAQTHPASETAMVDVGNKICPVSGDKVSGKHFFEYEGKRYALCCDKCLKHFNKDPDKYIAKVNAMMQGTQADIPDEELSPVEGSNNHDHEHHDHSDHEHGDAEESPSVTS